MKRLLLLACLSATVAAVSVPALAGGDGGGGGTKGTIPVRIKNIGAAPVAVNSQSGSVPLGTLVGSARTIAANGISEFMVNEGEFSALSADPNAPLAVNKERAFSTRTFKTIYLYAEQDMTAATLVGAPGGVKF